MKQLITKDEVEQAMRRLADEGKKPTLLALHAALDHRGSMSTLVRLRGEIANASASVAESPEALKSFKELWTTARNEGREEQQQVITELQSSVAALAAENERLEGLLVAARKHGADLEAERFQIFAQLNETRSASSQVAQALRELADARAQHAAQVAVLQGELRSAKQNTHDCELQLVRARAFLEARGAAGERLPLQEA